MRTTKPTVEEFSGSAPEYYAAVQEYNRYLERKFELANAIIGPAAEILPETYDKEIKAYYEYT